MSASKPNLYNLLSQNCSTEIEEILESNEYTRNEKIEKILTKRAHPSAGGQLHFVTICVSPLVSLDFSMKVLHYLGEDLSRPICIECLKEIFSDAENQARPIEDKACLLAVVAEELQASKFNEVKSFLLVVAIMNDADLLMIFSLLQYGSKEKETTFIKHRIAISCSQSYFRTDETKLLDPRSEDNNEDGSLVYDATILEIALHKRANYEVIKKIVEIGGKELLSISTRSLLHLTIAEYGGNVVTSIVKLLLEVGGRDLLMLEEHWYPIHQNGGLFQFLNSNKHQFHLPNEEILNIMNLCLDVGGRDFVLNKTQIGQTILHEFRFFNDHHFIPLVRRILDYGGMDLFKVKSQGGTILHGLARATNIHKSYWDLFQFNKEIVVMIDDKGKTALHEVCSNIYHGNYEDRIASSKFYFISLLLLHGGKELAWSRVKADGNTALHLLPFKNLCDGENFKVAEMIIRRAGMDIIRCRNNKGKEPFTPFINFAIEFQMNEEGNLSTMKEPERQFTSMKQIWNEGQCHEYNFDFENEQQEAKRDMEEEESDSSRSVHTSSAKDEKSMEHLKALLTSKERENDALKQRIHLLENETSNSSNEIQRAVDNANQNFISPIKRSRTNSDVVKKDELEIEIEDLMNQLEQEKSSHMRTMQRLKELRKALRQKR